MADPISLNQTNTELDKPSDLQNLLTNASNGGYETFSLNLLAESWHF